MKTRRNAALFAALAEPNRLDIVDYLYRKDACICICDIAKLIRKDQSVAFRHIKILESAGIVRTGKRAKFLMCCIKDKSLVRRLLG